MKIIFLDIDGVLNSERWMRNNEGAIRAGTIRPSKDVDREAVARLNRLVEATGALVVISSTWRLFGIMAVKDTLYNHGFAGKVLDVTPHGLPGRPERGHEIMEWLNRRGHDVESFVIIDDDSDMVHLTNRLVQTNWQTGLLDEHVEAAVQMLNTPAP